MPIYVFRCPRCGKQLEELRRVGNYSKPYCYCENMRAIPMELAPTFAAFKIDQSPLAGIPENQSALMHGRTRLD